MAVTRHAGAALLVVPNASPYERGKDDVRLDLVQRRAREAGAVLAYCNLVGGQDELVFDGDSILVSAAGEPLARGPQFEEALIVADLELPAASAAVHRDSGEAVDAGDGSLITIERVALPDICRRSRRTRTWRRLRPASLGRSGRGLTTSPRCTRRWCSAPRTTCGRTGSARCCSRCPAVSTPRWSPTIAADAIGPEHVHVILMPSKWSSDHSVTDAEDLVERQGLQREDHRDPGDRGRVPRRARRLPACRAARGEPAVPGARRDQHGRVQRRGPPRAHHGQQERARHRVLDPVRGLGGRLRPHQGRAEDAGLGAVPVAQRGRRGGRAALRRSRRTRSRSRRPPSSRPGSSTPTRCPTIPSSTHCSTITSRRTWGPRS